MAEKKSPLALVGLLFVLAMLMVALFMDRRARRGVEAVADRITALAGHDGPPTQIFEVQKGTPTRDEIEAVVGKKPTIALTAEAQGQFEVYHFGTLRRYAMYVFYTKGTNPNFKSLSLFKKP